jgi:hypothetical protein
MDSKSILHYITVATKPHHILDKIKEKVQQNGETILVLGLEENRTIGWEGQQNFGVKLREVSQFLRNPALESDDIVLFTDAYDVVYCGTLEEIKTRFLSMNKPIIFGAEKYCNPDPNRAIKYKVTETEFPFLNSGMFIGRVWALRECIENYQYNDKDDDQRYWTTQFFQHPELIGLDYENTLFLNTVSMDEKYFFLDKRDYVAIYKSATPQFVHVNGPVKTDLYTYLSFPSYIQGNVFSD